MRLSEVDELSDPSRVANDARWVAEFVDF